MQVFLGLKLINVKFLLLLSCQVRFFIRAVRVLPARIWESSLLSVTLMLSLGYRDRTLNVNEVLIYIYPIRYMCYFFSKEDDFTWFYLSNAKWVYLQKVCQWEVVNSFHRILNHSLQTFYPFQKLHGGLLWNEFIFTLTFFNAASVFFASCLPVEYSQYNCYLMCDSACLYCVCIIIVSSYTAQSTWKPELGLRRTVAKER